MFQLMLAAAIVYKAKCLQIGISFKQASDAGLT